MARSFGCSSSSFGVVFLLLLASWQSGSCDKIELWNRLRSQKAIGLQCQDGDKIDRYELILAGNKTLIEVKKTINSKDRVPLAHCLGTLLEVSGGYFVFPVYSAYKDHQRCKDKCILEVRDFGVYAWNLLKNDWEITYQMPDSLHG